MRLARVTNPALAAELAAQVADKPPPEKRPYLDNPYPWGGVPKDMFVNSDGQGYDRAKEFQWQPRDTGVQESPDGRGFHGKNFDGAWGQAAHPKRMPKQKGAPIARQRDEWS